ncbi:MAG: ATP-binding protein, partial [Candidatus Thermoplasmatota archaeon]|nr:ATP-binding protein [Candidatus Thermoplasmatota archaeon]
MSGDADEVSGTPEYEMNGLVEAMPPVENDVEVTVWSAESDDASDEAILGQPSDEVLQSSVEAWIDDIGMTSTKEVPVPDRLVDQVIGQEAGSVIIRKAAEQRRHMLMIGDPGTGKSMLARSMTELLPRDALEDVLVYPNEEDENEPRVRSVPAGRGDRIVKVQKEAIRVQREKTQRMLLIGFVAIAFLLAIATLQSGDIVTLLFGMFLLTFGYMFLRSRLGAADESRIPKVLVKHD